MSETVGERLRKVRLEKHLTLEEASKNTHIRVHYLEALENDQRHILPSEAQGRGFLRLYADYLGEPAQPLLDMWLGLSETPPEEALVSEETALPPVESFNERSVPPQEFEALPAESPVLDEEQSQEKTPSLVARLRNTPAQLVGRLKTARIEIKSRPVAAPVVEPIPSDPGQAFLEIGSTLRQQRESLGLTLVDIERYTHVRLRFLQALEDGDVEALPSPVQGRGMLVNYARFLDMDVEAVLLRFAEGLQARHEEKGGLAEPPRRGKPRRQEAQPAPLWRRLISPDLLVGGIVLVAMIGFVIWSATQIISLRNQVPQQPTAPGLSNVLLATPSSTPEAPVANETAQPDVVEAPGETQAAAGIQPGEQEPLAEGSQTPAAEETALTGTAPSLGGGQIQVYVVARQRTYLRVSVDGKVVFNGRVQPGNAYPYSGSQQIELVTGNAAALQVVYNQNDLGTIGNVGQVTRLLFTRSGMMTPTAMFTASPTSTLLATLTLMPTGTPTQIQATITPYIP